MNDSQSRIEILAAWLDKVLPPGQRGIRKEIQDPLLKAAVDFAKAPFPELSPEAMTRVRARMLSAYTPPRRVIRFPDVRRLSMVASLAVVLLVGGLVPAAAASLPGETLYPVKLGYESVELLIAAGLHKEGEMYVAHSERRLAEAETLLHRGVFSQEAFSAALTNASHALAADPDAADRVRTVVLRAETSLVSAQQARIVDHAVIDSLETDLQTLQAAADASTVSSPTPVPASTDTPAEAVPSATAPVQQTLIVVSATHTAMPTLIPTETLALPASPTVTLTVMPTETVTPTLTATATETATMTPTATETATMRPPATRTPRPRPVATRVPTLQASDEGANGQPADPGSQGNNGNGQPADPGNQGNNVNNGNGQPDNSGSQGNNGKPDDPGSNGNLGQGQSNPPPDNSSSNNAGGNSGGKGK